MSPKRSRPLETIRSDSTFPLLKTKIDHGIVGKSTRQAQCETSRTWKHRPSSRRVESHDPTDSVNLEDGKCWLLKEGDELEFHISR